MAFDHPTRPRTARIGVPFLAALIWAGIGCAPEVEEADPAATANLLLITLDTVRADRLSAYGHERSTTPNLDALARDGARFERAIAQAALTPVSHASILSGLIPPHHGLRVVYADVIGRLRSLGYVGDTPRAR